MTQNTNQETPAPVPRKRMSDFRKALLWTAIPIFILSSASASGVAAAGDDEAGAIIFGLLWVGAALYFLGAILALIIFAIMRKSQVVAGLLAGLGIGIVSMGATCFAMLSTSSFY